MDSTFLRCCYIFSDSENIIANESNIVYMFSEQYIRDNFLNFDSQSLLKNNVKTNSINENRNPELAEALLKLKA